MRLSYILLFLTLYTNSIFAQSSRHWTVYGHNYVYEQGKLSQKEDQIIKTASSIASLKRLSDGTILAVGENTTLLLNNTKLEEAGNNEFTDISATKLCSLLKSKKTNFQYLMGDWDQSGNFYFPDLKAGWKIINHKTTIKGDVEEDEWSLYNITGLKKGFIAGQLKYIENNEGKKTPAYRLIHFDGENVTTHKLPSEKDNSPLMTVIEEEHILTDIFEDKQGNYWVTGKNKVFLFKEGQLEEQFSVDEDEIKQFAVNKHGEALIALSNGTVITYNIRSKKTEWRFDKSESIIYGVLNTEGVEVTDIEVDNQNRFVLSSGVVAVEYHNTNNSFITKKTVKNGALVVFDLPAFQSQNSLRVLNTYTDRDAKFMNLVGQDRLTDNLGNQYILAVDGESFKKIDAEGNIKEFNAGALTKSAGYKYPDVKLYPQNWSIDKNSGTLYFSTPSMKYTFQMKVDESIEQLTFGLDEHWNCNKVKRMVHDHVNDALWLVTGEGYVYHPMNGDSIQYYTTEETGLETGYGLHQLEIDEKGTLWVSHLKGLGEFNKDGFKLHKNPAGGYLSMFMVEDYQGTPYSIGKDAIYKLKEGVFTEVVPLSTLQKTLKEQFPVQLLSSWVKHVCFDKSNQLWATTQENKIVHYDGQQWKIYSPENFYAGRNIINMFLDQQDRVSIVTAEKPVSAMMTSLQKNQKKEEQIKKTFEEIFLEKVEQSIQFETAIILVDKNLEY
ncbi:hypothetical protein [Flammeovirga sp. SJP92]|uniref:hypothetical protein n=1 Tax=Flammeovirga sp. SJP92 TaxID=1775430 RepID=UPI000789401B|nr:hypothetical protein [Flammeovirga sp. SJP92]KXX67786.1 hypothetical protein AVL50_25320 [Flammeovirga sp. SJP92]